VSRERLADLDELVLRCRNEQAQQLISEAVACYHAGAYRYAIVATWNAIVFDFIRKLQDLELTGDKNARQKLEQLERMRFANDVKAALDFEREVLDIAMTEFELLSPLEYADLSRVFEDRSRCAHPSINSLEEIYQPTPELARTHIRNAVTHMLQHPPVQGKAALDRLAAEVASQYFPSTLEDAIRHFQQGPLARPREALVTSSLFC
jgi:hypothetical protein